MKFDKRILILGAALAASSPAIAQYRFDTNTANGVRQGPEKKTLEELTAVRNGMCKMETEMMGKVVTGNIVEIASGKATPFDCRTVLQQLQKSREAKK